MVYCKKKQMTREKIILMKVTSRGRPDALVTCIRAYTRKAADSENMRWLITLDSNDMTLPPDIEQTIQEITSGSLSCAVIFGKSYNKIHAVNRDINTFDPPEWDILLSISDDQLPIVEGYDTVIRTKMPSHLDASLWFYDGYQNQINTQEIQGFEYYRRLHYVYNPIYKSYCCDNESTAVASRKGLLLKFGWCIIKHHHPLNDSDNQWDSTYINCKPDWKEDVETYKKRKRVLFK